MRAFDGRACDESIAHPADMARICEEKSMPLNYTNKVMKCCIERMEDVASSVRKSAFQLLCDLIRTNPYGIVSIEMSLGQIQLEYAKEAETLQKINQEGNFKLTNLKFDILEIQVLSKIF